jgi:hypothetical protein
LPQPHAAKVAGKLIAGICPKSFIQGILIANSASISYTGARKGMWPFSTKEPLSPDKLPVPDNWTQRKGSDPIGKPMLVRAQAGYSKYKGVLGYWHHVAIAVPMIDTTRDGFPNPGETQDQKRIESDICEVFEANRESLFVATTTVPGIREYILYTRNPDAVQHKFDNDLLARVFSHRVHIKIQPDKNWDIYNKLL